MLDGDSKELKEQIKNVFKDELLHFSLQKTSKNKVDFLIEKYGKVQVNPREINLFIFPKPETELILTGKNILL